MRTRFVGGVLLALSVLAGCTPSAERETRTFRLNRLSPDQAADLAGAYLSDGGAVTVTSGTLTVRATPEEMGRVESLLAEYDRGASNVLLRFQILEADGFEGSDPAIADVEAALRDLFRYRGYRLAAEAVVRASEHGDFLQQVPQRDGAPFVLDGSVGQVTPAGEVTRIQLRVELGNRSGGRVLATSVNAVAGETLVLGSGRPEEGSGAVILVVRPSVDPAGGSSPSPDA